ncbi:autotransporter domain-containing protein [Hansschlegelia beijingensis]
MFAEGRAELGSFFAGLDATAGADLGRYEAAIAEVSPRSISTLFARVAADASRIADASMSCPVFDAGTSGSKTFLTEGSCVYGTTRGQRASFKGDANRGKSDMDSLSWQVGVQGELDSGLLLGGSLAYQADSFNGHDGVSAKGSSVQGALTLKRQSGPFLLTGALFGSYGDYDIKRRISAAGYAATAKSDSDAYSAGVRARVAYTLGAEDFYLRPYLNLDLVHARNSGFSEKEKGGLGLTISHGSYTSAIVTPALEIGRADEVWGGRTLRSFVTVGLNVRTTDEWRSRGKFSAGSSSDDFRLNAPLDRVTGRTSAGLQLYQDNSIDLRVQYDGEFGRETTKHGATASVSYRF